MMRNLKHTKEDCFLCQGSGEIKVSPDDLMLCLAGEFKICPLCEGSRHLNIITTKRINNV
jgi:hypothetical protein